MVVNWAVLVQLLHAGASWHERFAFACFCDAEVYRVQIILPSAVDILQLVHVLSDIANDSLSVLRFVHITNMRNPVDICQTFCIIGLRTSRNILSRELYLAIVILIFLLLVICCLLGLCRGSLFEMYVAKWQYMRGFVVGCYLSYFCVCVLSVRSQLVGCKMQVHKTSLYVHRSYIVPLASLFLVLGGLLQFKCEWLNKLLNPSIDRIMFMKGLYSIWA